MDIVATAPVDETGRRAVERLPRDLVIPILAFLLLSLIALVVVPLLSQRRIDDARAMLGSVGDPASALIHEVNSMTAVEMAALNGYLLTGDAHYLGRYRAALDRERTLYGRLAPLVARLSPDLAGNYYELRAAKARWLAATEDVVTGRITPAAFRSRVPAMQSLYEQALFAGNRLAADIRHDQERRRIELSTRQTDSNRTEIALVLVALAAAFAVSWLVYRLRQLALGQQRLAEQLARRARDEARLRELARSLTGAHDVREVLRRISESALEGTGAQSAYVEQLDAASAQVVVAASAGGQAPPLETRVPYPGSVAEEAVLSGDVVMVPDVGADARPMSRLLRSACGDCMQLVVPLVSDGAALGALGLLRTRQGPAFGAEQIARARVLADLASLALRRVALLEEADRRRADAEHLLESKFRLVRGLGHDLKNPLGAAEGYAQLLETGIHGQLTGKQREYLGLTRRSLRAALDLINDMLELSRAEAGRLRVAARACDVAVLAEEIAAEHRGTAERAGLVLEAKLCRPLPPVQTDPARVRQILGNLIGNAIKYTPEGGRVTVLAAARARLDVPGVALDVVDTGYGIPHDELDHIFEEFHRLELSDEIDRGAGLGLAVSRRIARILGGELTVTSHYGDGATFTLWLPATAITAGTDSSA